MSTDVLTETAAVNALLKAAFDGCGSTALLSIRLAELHWYEAHGIGKKELKPKKYLD